MLTLILFVILGLGIAFFAIQNTSPVSINLAGMSFSGIPLYVIMLVSLLAGLIAGWVISLFDWASTTMTLRRKDVRLHKAEQTIGYLTDRVATLEHSGLKGGYVEREIHENVDDRKEHGFFRRIGRRFRAGNQHVER